VLELSGIPDDYLTLLSLKSGSPKLLDPDLVEYDGDGKDQKSDEA
jgi:hypothetical protein